MPLQPIRKQEIRCIYCGSATGSIIEKIPAILDFPSENFCVQLLRTNDFLKLPSNFTHHFILSCVVSSVVNHGEIKMHSNPTHVPTAGLCHFFVLATF